MRYLVVCVLAGLLAQPQSVAAQTGEEAPANAGAAVHAHHLPPQFMLRTSYFYLPEHLEQRRPGHQQKETAKEPTSEPESKFSLEYQEQKSPEVEEMELRVKRAWIGFGVSGAAGVGGLVLTMVAFSQGSIADPYPGWVDPAIAAGLAVSLAGICGMISSYALVRVRKRELRRLREAHYRSQGRGQWDLARSRLVF
jgi:hypothetical protein